MRKKSETISKEMIIDVFDKEKNLYTTAKKLNIAVLTLRRLIKLYNLELGVPTHKNEINMKDQQCGLLKVIRKEGKNAEGRIMWLCKCACGRERVAVGKFLRSGDITHCGCQERKYDGILPGHIYHDMKFRAQRRKEWNITYEYLCELYQIQEGKCALTGRKLTFCETREDYIKNRKENMNASIDRIDSSKGYVEGNVQWVHKYVNKLKSNLSQTEFFSLCEEVTEWKNKCKH